MSKKLQGNGLWESSRMMLPEHRSQILKSNKELTRSKMPVLHEDEITLINENVARSYAQKETLEVLIFGEWGNRKEIGVVTSIHHQKKFKLDFDEGYEWIDFSEVLSTKIVDS
ncbi:YolD-like family protein [Paenibacillus oleatilyticus]|uniref:YolD-like family protein n=1 Tax=Paenibacillus oleatilyticus TaxID=2594886 RepID=UPI001C1F6316|nr:YolD-like family protein [Paenibacillus oleatilyticus]MBU7315996.1 YolD-like family protein [Paenibacillus oleatilyticus]